MTGSDPQATRVRGLFDAAVEMPAGEREAFLERECGDAAELRQRVRALLAAHERPGFLDRPVAPHQRETIGPFHVLERLGEGGMGEVFLAEQRDPMQRQVAVKVIKLGMDTRAVLQRFRQEYQVLAVLEHPNIASVYEAGATDNGRPYFAMEFVRGSSLTRYCDDNGLTVRARIELFIAVCRAVQHAHQKGIIHRDLKPSNILVSEQHDAAAPKIIDFGIAKATSGPDGGHTVYTRLGDMVGTPDYMSPEQADPTETDIDTRSDVYSLGVVLHELLVGRLPFGDSLRYTNLTEARRVIREARPTRPSETPAAIATDHTEAIAAVRGTDTQGLVSQTRGDLDWIVLKCLEKDRARRYDSAAELAADLRRHLDHEPVLAGPPTLTYRLSKSLRRYRRALVVAAGFALAVTTLAVWALVEKERSDENARQARAALSRARTMTTFLSETLAGANPYSARGMDTTLLMRLADDAAERIRNGELAGEPEAECELRLVLADVYHNISAFEPQAQILEPVERLVHAAGLEDCLLHANVLQRLGRRHAEQSTQRALELYDRSIAMRRRLEEPDATQIAWALLRKAHVLDRMGRSKAMLETANEAMSIWARIDAEPSAIVQTLQTKAQSLRRLGRPGDALPVAQRALELAVERLDRDNVEQLLARNEVGWALIDLRRPDEALRQFESSLAIAARVHSGPHELTAHILRSIGIAWRDQGDGERAVDYARRTLAMRQTLQPHGGGEVADATLELAIALKIAGQPEQAVEHSAEAVTMRRKLHDRAHPDLAAALYVHAGCLQRVGRHDEVIRNCEEAIAIWRDTFDSPRAELAKVEFVCGEAHFARGEFDQAIERYRAARAQCDLVHRGPNNGSTWMVRRTADSLRQLRRFPEAAEQYDEAERLARQLPPPIREELDRIDIGRGQLLAARSRFVEAEALLEQIRASAFEATPAPPQRTDYVDARVSLYRQWNKPERAAEWEALRAGR